MRLYLLLSLTLFALLAESNPSNARQMSENNEQGSLRRLDQTDPPTDPAGDGMTGGTQNPTSDSTAEGTDEGTDGTQQGGGGDDDPTPVPAPLGDETPAPGDDGGFGDTPTLIPVPGDDPTLATPVPAPTEIDGGGGIWDISQPPTAAEGGGDDLTDAPTPADGNGGFDQPTFQPAPSPTVTEPPQFPTLAPAYPTWPTDPPQIPTDAPAVPYIAPEDDIVNPEEESEITDEWKWGEGETLEEMEHDKNVLIALSVVGAIGLCFALISAQQIIENPDGCCASICRMWVACLCGITRCVCWPCRYVCGCTGRDRRNHDLIMAGDSNYTHDLELS